jgi:hypothetical protein
MNVSKGAQMVQTKYEIKKNLMNVSKGAKVLRKKVTPIRVKNINN